MANPNAQDVARRLLVLSGLIAYSHAMPPPHVWTEIYPKWPKSDQEQFFEEFKKFPQSVAAFFRQSGVWNDMSPKENDFLHTHPQDLKFQDRINISWQIEGAAALLWAIGTLPEFPPFDRQSDQELVKLIPRKETQAFVETARLRPAEQLEAMRSRAQTWHWRSRTRQLIEAKEPFPNVPQAPQFRSFDDVVRFASQKMKEAGTLGETPNEDFPAKGKAYRDLTGEEWSEVRSITVERHFAMNWVCGYAPGNRWDETPTET